MDRNVRVVGETILAPPPEEAEQCVPGVQYEPKGQLPSPELVDTAIEDPERRSRIPEGQGNISVSILPGAELGHLIISVQFEGRRGDHDFCVAEHNELLLRVDVLLRELLADLQGEFDVTFAVDPCPKAGVQVRLDLAAQVLETEKVAAAQVSEAARIAEMERVLAEVLEANRQTQIVQTVSTQTVRSGLTHKNVTKVRE